MDFQSLLSSYQDKKVTKKGPANNSGKRARSVVDEVVGHGPAGVSSSSKKAKSNKVTFVHPTKNGGTAIEQYLAEYYSSSFEGKGHDTTCSYPASPLIVIREPFSRFISMYKYWKFGGNYVYQRDKAFLEKYENTSLSDFLKMIRLDMTNDLHHGFTWHHHFSPQSHWLHEQDYSKTIVIIYDKHRLQEKLFAVFDFLGIPNIGKELPFVNISGGQEEQHTLTEKEMKQLRAVYKDDFDLWDKLTHQLDLFRFVV